MEFKTMTQKEINNRLTTAIRYGMIMTRKQVIEELKTREADDDTIRIIKLGRNKYYYYYTC